jgi:hypothetical protein
MPVCFVGRRWRVIFHGGEGEEHPHWVSDGYLHDEFCSHKLVILSEKSTLIPYRNGDWWVLATFEEGNKSWMRYPCSRRVSDLQIEPQFHDKLWDAYLRVMRGYGWRLAATPDVPLRGLVAELAENGIGVSYYAVWHAVERESISFKKA